MTDNAGKAVTDVGLQERQVRFHQINVKAVSIKELGHKLQLLVKGEVATGQNRVYQLAGLLLGFDNLVSVDHSLANIEEVLRTLGLYLRSLQGM